MLRTPIIFLYVAIIAIASCKNDPSVQVTQSTLARVDTIQTAAVDKDAMAKYVVTSGTVVWLGTKSVGGTHEGTISVASGELIVRQGELVSGSIVLDMHSLAVTSIKDGGEKRDLESHLKDVDFFEVNKFPKAVFTFNEVLPSNTPDFNEVIAGQLTMKGKTGNVNVPVQLRISGNDLTAQSPSFSINRTTWGITFRSGIIGTVKDKLIEDTVLLSLKLSAQKQD